MSDLKLNVRTRGGKKIELSPKGFEDKSNIPGVVYGDKIDTISIQAKRNEFTKIYELGGRNHVIEVSMGDDGEVKALIHDVQINPRTNQINHFDLLKINMDKKIKTSIPIHFTGESPVVNKEGVVSTLMDVVEVEALPGDLPESYDVDLSVLEEIGQSILLKDIVKNSSKVEILSNMDEIVAKADQQRAEEEEPIETDETEDTEEESENEDTEEKSGEESDDTESDKSDSENEQS